MADFMSKFQGPTPKAPKTEDFKQPQKVVTKEDQAHMAHVYEKISKASYEALTMKAESMVCSADDMMVSATRLFLANAQYIEQIAVCECTKLNTKIRNSRLAYDPQEGTIDDPRMGTLNFDMVCKTCMQNVITCPGHIGYIQLPIVVVHPLLRKIATYFMNIFCSTCGKNLCTREDCDKLSGQHPMMKLKNLSDVCSKKSAKTIEAEFGVIHAECDHMSYVTESRQNIDTTSDDDVKIQYSIFSVENKHRSKTHTAVDSDRLEEIITMIQETPEVHQILQYLGFSLFPRQRDGRTVYEVNVDAVLLSKLPVLPPASRPFGIIQGDQTCHPLTRAYTELLETIKDEEKTRAKKPQAKKPGGRAAADAKAYSQFIRKKAEDKKMTVDDELEHQNNFLYRKIREVFTIIQDQIKGKDGIIRGLSMGKRVDYCGRSVLNPFNKLRFGEIAYPSHMRQTHTRPIMVVPFNIEKLTEFYKRGDVMYIIIGDHSEMSRNRLQVDEKMRLRYSPQIGDTVELIGMDGDETLFNRQPTLDKLSIMGYRAKYIADPEYLCVGIHSSYTSPHNADFDGDEGNKHAIQTLDARAETRFIASVEACTMNAKASKPTMGLVYNCLSSGYLMSLYDTPIDDDNWNAFVDLLDNKDHLASLPERLAKHGVPERQGKALFSILLPEDFYYNHSDILIKDGVLISGTLKSDHLGNVGGSIVHHLWKFYGRNRTSRFFTEGQWLLDAFIEYRGFTMGFSACVPANPEKIKDILDAELTDAKIKIAALGPKTSDMTAIEAENHERTVMSYLNSVSRIGEKISLDAIEALNPCNVMMNSGAKGKPSNVAQILGCLGQQFVQGARPARNMTGKTRSLPYFEPNSDDVEADGFIPESFMHGSKPSGFMYHMMASRVGLMDTALKTADIGHMHHRMVKVLEDLTVSYDGSVRNANGTVFSYSYSDGFSAAEVMKTQCSTLGTTLSFIDMRAVVGRLNAEAGF